MDETDGGGGGGGSDGIGDGDDGEPLVLSYLTATSRSGRCRPWAAAAAAVNDSALGLQEKAFGF